MVTLEERNVINDLQTCPEGRISLACVENCFTAVVFRLSNPAEKSWPGISMARLKVLPRAGILSTRR